MKKLLAAETATALCVKWISVCEHSILQHSEAKGRANESVLLLGCVSGAVYLEDCCVQLLLWRWQTQRLEKRSSASSQLTGLEKIIWRTELTMIIFRKKNLNQPKRVMAPTKNQVAQKLFHYLLTLESFFPWNTENPFIYLLVFRLDLNNIKCH